MNTSLNRRDFLKLGGGALAVAALQPVGLVAEDKVPAPAASGGRKKAIMYGTIRGDQSVLEKFKLIKAAGFDVVEPNSGMDQGEVLKARDATGLETPSVCDSVHWAKQLTDPN